MKRAVYGTHHSISEAHLPRYLGEWDFKWNTRKLKDGERAALIAKGIEGKRLIVPATSLKPKTIKQMARRFSALASPSICCRTALTGELFCPIRVGLDPRAYRQLLGRCRCCRIDIRLSWKICVALAWCWRETELRSCAIIVVGHVITLRLEDGCVIGLQPTEIETVPRSWGVALTFRSEDGENREVVIPRDLIPWLFNRLAGEAALSQRDASEHNSTDDLVPAEEVVDPEFTDYPQFTDGDEDRPHRPVAAPTQTRRRVPWFNLLVVTCVGVAVSEFSFGAIIATRLTHRRHRRDGSICLAAHRQRRSTARNP